MKNNITERVGMMPTREMTHEELKEAYRLAMVKMEELEKEIKNLTENL